MTGLRRVVLAEDSVLLRDGVVRLLSQSGFDVVAHCDNATELVALVEQHLPDLVISDVRMPPTFTSEGIHAALQIRREHPEIALVVLSQYVEEDYAVDLLSTPHGLGYLLKDRITDTREFIAALHHVLEGGTSLDPEVVRQLMARSRPANPLQHLTPRERHVLELMAQGDSNAAIAQACHISTSSVEKHIASIFQKLQLDPAEGQHRRVMAVLSWLRYTPGGTP